MAWSEAARRAAIESRKRRALMNRRGGKKLVTAMDRVGASRSEVAKTLKDYRSWNMKQGVGKSIRTRNQMTRSMAADQLETYGAVKARGRRAPTGSRARQFYLRAFGISETRRK